MKFTLQAIDSSSAATAAVYNLKLDTSDISLKIFAAADLRCCQVCCCHPLLFPLQRERRQSAARDRRASRRRFERTQALSLGSSTDSA